MLAADDHVAPLRKRRVGWLRAQLHTVRCAIDRCEWRRSVFAFGRVAINGVTNGPSELSGVHAGR